MRRAGWCRCQGLLSCGGGCIGFGVFGLGQKVGPVAKTSLGLVGLWEEVGVGVGAAHLRSSTSFASFLIADGMSPAGP